MYISDEPRGIPHYAFPGNREYFACVRSYRVGQKTNCLYVCNLCIQRHRTDVLRVNQFSVLNVTSLEHCLHAFLKQRYTEMILFKRSRSILINVSLKICN